MPDHADNPGRVQPPLAGGPESLPADERHLLRLAEVALERYGLRDVRIDLLQRDAKKQFFRVASSDRGEFVLRMYRLSYAPWDRNLTSEEALRSQSLWLEALSREAGLSVPDPIPTLDGATTSCASVAGLSRLRICVLQRWIPGRRKAPKELRPHHLSLLGSYVARMHNHAERYSPPEGFQRPKWGWNQLFGDSAPLWKEGRKFYSPKEMSVFHATSRRVLRNLRVLGEGAEVFGLIHRDLNRSNLLFHEGGVSAVDFDGCGWGYYLYDLAFVLLNLEEARGGSAKLQAALLKGYHAERPLPANHRELLDTFITMRRIAKINRNLTQNVGKQRGSNLVPDTMEKLREFTEDERGPRNYVSYKLSSRARHLKKWAARAIYAARS